MKQMVIQYIEKNIGKTELITLISGGSSWADHVAIQLFLEYQFSGLQLYLPSDFNINEKRYINTHEGRTLNALHQECKEKTGIDTLNELSVIMDKASITVQRGFIKRNTLIARKCDYLIAFTFNDNVCEGVTLDTWNKVKHKNKINYNLNLASQDSF